MDDIFGSEGCLSGILPFFEYRRQQDEMASFVEHSISSGGVVFVEAGTGTGKTVAYLIPALLYCLREGKILAVSTETKTLQKQLVDKDLPLVHKVVSEHYGIDFRYSVCFGSANYPCRKRFELMVGRGGFLFEEKDGIDGIAELFERGETFTRYDVDVSPGVWKEIERDSDMCGGYDCAFGKVCAFQRARREWFSSQLLVMNHYLFFSNVAAGKTYLPRFDAVIFDEAHSVEQIAARQLGFNLSYRLLLDILERYHHRNKKMLLPKIGTKSVQDEARALFFEIEKEGRAYFEQARKMTDDRKRSFRLKDPYEDGSDLLELIERFIEVVSSAEDDFCDEPEKSEYEAARSKFSAFKNALVTVTRKKQSDMVVWIDREDSMMATTICGTPVDAGPLMETEIYSFYEYTAFVSATLSVNGDFSFIQERLGAKDADCVSFDSPFDYATRVLLYLPDDLPSPQETGFTDALVERCARLVRACEGNCLILFTSYEMLKDAVPKLRSLVDNEIFSQGESDAVKSVADYCSTPGAVLAGTHSFWQGLDLPGDLVKCVIITKLPFPVPDRPEIEARTEVLAKKGVNPFNGFHVPTAVIQFKQGFGRLMRRHTDRGVVAVLDNRLMTKGYGKTFLKSVPECVTSSSLKDVESFMKRPKKKGKKSATC
jgi:ATP-dependent DNA helicase DinG